MRRTLIALLLVGFAAKSVVAAEPKEKQPAADEPYRPTSQYVVKCIRGWKVYVDPTLLNEQKEIGQRALELLDIKLYDVIRAVPPEALEKLQQVPLWLEFADPKVTCACYHPSRGWLIEHGVNPDKTKAVEFGNAIRFIDWTHEQPYMVLHELAHAYQDIFLSREQFEKLRKQWEKAKESGKYDKVVNYRGKQVRHYAMNNPKEYFAELTEAFFGRNDYYPFVQAELIEFDPEGAKLIAELWGVPLRWFGNKIGNKPVVAEKGGQADKEASKSD